MYTVKVFGMNNDDIFTIRKKQDVELVIDNLTSLRECRICQCTGIVRARRNRKHIIFYTLDVLDGLDGFVPSMLVDKRDTIDNSVQLVVELSSANQDLQRQIDFIRKGSIVSCHGIPVNDRPGSLSIFASCATLVRCSPEPDAIWTLLKAVSEGVVAFSTAEKIRLFDCDEQTLNELASLVSVDDPLLQNRISKHSREMVSTVQYCSSTTHEGDYD